jgi:hypothetical protein
MSHFRVIASDSIFEQHLFADTASRSRRVKFFARGLIFNVSPSKGRGNAGRLMHPQPGRQKKSQPAKSPQIHQNNPALRTQWFTAYSALSPVIGLF